MHAETLRQLRVLSALSITLVVAEVLYSRFAWARLPEHLIELLSLNGINALLAIPESVFLAYPYIQIALLIGLMIPMKYSRAAFLANVVFYQVIFALSGISIGLAGQSVIFVIQAYAYGAIIYVLMTAYAKEPDKFA